MSVLTSVAEKYGATRFIKTSHKVTSCTWDSSLKKWILNITNLESRVEFEDVADVLIAARGNLNDIRWPSLHGLETFKGEVTHSAAWNEKYDFGNKKVGVIGGGSSSIQIVPKLQKVEGTSLTCFVRSKIWISNPFGDKAMEKLGLNPKKLDFSEEQRRVFKSEPDTYLKFRKAIETDGNTVHGISQKDSEIQRQAVEEFRAMMKERLSKRPGIVDALTPSFAVGCRRLTPGPGYLEALVEDNVAFFSDPIAAVRAEGIEMEDGRIIELDVIVCATGFHTSVAPPFGVTGKDRLTLRERWTPHPETYLTVAVDGFPNYFMMLGPNAAIGPGSLTMILETQGDYITRCIRKLQKEDYLSMTPKHSRVQDFSAYIGEYFKRTVYLDSCNSWYRSEGGRGDRITALWPGSTLHALETLRAPRWEDFEFESNQENLLRWLGNGWSVTQQEEGGDAAWYLEPSNMDIPMDMRPRMQRSIERDHFLIRSDNQNYGNVKTGVWVEAGSAL